MSAPNRKGMGLGDALLVWLAIGAIVVFGGGTYAPPTSAPGWPASPPLRRTRLT